MALNPKLIAIIGRINPAIYDIIFPHGPIRFGVEDVVSRVALNPQPLPPVGRRAKAAFDPQPDPPGVALGAQVGYELVRAAGFARAFAGAGASVVLGARRESALADLADEIGSAGGRTVVRGTDVTEPDACAALVEAGLAEFGRIDVLVNSPTTRRPHTRPARLP